MITRSNLAEQLREYQIRSKHEWSSFSFFSSTSNSTSSRNRRALHLVSLTQCLSLRLHGDKEFEAEDGKTEFASANGLTVLTSFELYFDLSWVDVMISVIWELVILAFLVFSGVALYFRYMRLAFCLICVTTLLLISFKIMKKVRQARKRKRRMLLPLSM